MGAEYVKHLMSLEESCAAQTEREKLSRPEPFAREA
jgi:hypothetical protein